MSDARYVLIAGQLLAPHTTVASPRAGEELLASIGHNASEGRGCVTGKVDSWVRLRQAQREARIAPRKLTAQASRWLAVAAQDAVLDVVE
jgi:hypothetical protein